MTPKADDPLTDREHSIMQRVLCGESDEHIALQLGIKRRTVSNGVQIVCQKFRARNRTAAAVRYVQRYGLPAKYQIPVGSVEPLAQQEQRVIDFAAQGATDREIAHYLGISQSTVRNYLLNIRRKLQAPNRVVAAVEYYRFQVLENHGKIRDSLNEQ